MSIEYEITNDICFTTVNGVKGTLGRADVEMLIHCAKKLTNESKYLETGSYLGCSALIIALHSNAMIWAHDIWVTEWSELKGSPPPEVKDYFYNFYKMVKDNKLTNRIVPIRGDSVYTVGIHDDKSIDLAFIDGDHSYDGCLNDLEAVLPKMKQDTVILVHDCYNNSECLKALVYFTNKYKLRHQYIPYSCGMNIIFVK